MEAWNSVSRFLTDHYGCVDAAALDAAGVTRHQLARWVAQRRLERCAPRVWRVVGAPVTWHQQLMAGLLSLGGDAAVSHWAAARLHGLDGASGRPVEFLVPNGRHNSALDAVVHRSGRIRRIDSVRVDGLRVTSATRTVLDLANAGVSHDRLAKAMDSAVHLQLTAPETVHRRLTTLRGKGRAGVRLVDELLVDSGGHTVLERAFLRLLREAGLPRPDPQVVFDACGQRVGRVDFAFRQWSIVVEVSGRQGHSSPSERARDAQRRNELQDIGLQVIEYTYDQVVKRAPMVAQQMRARLTAAGWAA